MTYTIEEIKKMLAEVEKANCWIVFKGSSPFYYEFKDLNLFKLISELMEEVERLRKLVIK